jgi:hypothetical protein
MKRTILSLTTAILVAAPAVAQTGVNATVTDVLTQNGYPASAIDMLSQGQIAELYVVATSEGAGDVSEVIASFDLPSDEGGDLLYDSPAMTDVEMTVMEVLDENGYDPDMVNALSGTSIANIYTAATGGSDTDVNDAIEEAIDAERAMMSEDPSMAEERATAYLARQGYSQSEIEAVEQAELLNIYNALSSGDREGIRNAVESALES